MVQNDILETGTRFGKYTIERLLGKGGMGAVYLVRHNILGSLFALKVLDTAVARRNGDFVTRFIREAKLASNIHHPNLASVHDAGLDEEHGLYYLVMDYLPGGSLRDRIDNLGRIPPVEAIRIVRQIASALVAADMNGMVHRDIKPENVMFTETGAAKLVDLGIAKGNGEQDTLETMPSSVFGTPAYMAPEQATDASSVDCRADIWSLGVMFYEMLSGKRPYAGNSMGAIVAQILSPDPFPDIRTTIPDIPTAIAELIGEMCMKDKNRRLANPGELLAMLDKLDLTFLPTSSSQKPNTDTHHTFATEVTLATVATVVAHPTDPATRVFVGPTSDHDIEESKAHIDSRAGRKKYSLHLRLAAGVLAIFVCILFGWILLRPSNTSVVYTNPAMSTNEVSATRTSDVATNVVVAVTNVNVAPPPSRSPLPCTNTPITSIRQHGPDEKIALIGIENEESVLKVHAGGRGRFYRIDGRPERVAAQISKVFAGNPTKLYLSLTGYAQKRDMSMPRFEQFLNQIGKTLMSANIPFVLLAGAGSYGRVVHSMAQEQSWDVTD